MEYFKSGLKSALGASTPDTQPTGPETVERLVNRVLSSTLLDDRRDACRALKALSRSYRVEVGAQGMDALKQVLETDRADCEIIGLALDTLCNLTSLEVFDEEIDKYGSKHNIGQQFTEIFSKNQESVSQVLRFLEEFDFKVRWPALKLLSNLTLNRPKDIQEIILVSPMGVSKLMDMLSDSREVIRNDALLLLIQLTRGNTNIQKIVAFENAFDRIYDVIAQEGGAEGGIVVEDCLLLMVNLLRGNYSNQNFFKEGSYIQRLTPMFQLPTDGNEDNSLVGWSPQKISNIHCMIQVIRALVAPSGPAQSVAVCQRIMNKCGLLQALCDILMISGVPADILTQTISAVAEVIRGNTDNQEFLGSVMAPSSPPRPAIVVLLMSMVNEKQPFLLRCAVLYCFQCFLYKNESRQMQLVQTLLPKGSETTSLTTGHLLCGGLFSPDSLSNWFSSVALSYALIDGPSQKEQLLQVHLATNIGTPPVTLMQRCVILLQQSDKLQSKLGLLILLCRWTSYSALAVKNFLTINSSISYLIALLSSHESNDEMQEMLLQSMCAFLIGICVHFNDDTISNYTKTKLCSLIENRIGLEKFQDTIGGITRHEVYSRSLKHPQPYAKDPGDVLLDHEFCRLLKVLESVVLKTVLDCSTSHQSKEQTSFLTQDSPLIAQYKELIREQDSQIRGLNQSVDRLQTEKRELERQVEELRCEVDSLTDQTKILRAAQTSYMEDKVATVVPGSNHVQPVEEELERYKRRVRELEDSLAKALIVTKETQQGLAAALEESRKVLDRRNVEYDELKKDQDDLLLLLTVQDNKIGAYRDKLIAYGEKFESDESSADEDQPESSN